MSDAALNLRQLAGIYLKNTILDLIKARSLPPVLSGYVQSDILSVLADPVRECRRIAAGIISSLLGGSPLVSFRSAFRIWNLVSFFWHYLAGAVATVSQNASPNIGI